MACISNTTTELNATVINHEIVSVNWIYFINVNKL